MVISADPVFSDGMIDQAKSTYNFLAMNVLFSQLQQSKKYQILDMGPATKANINFFSNFRCRIHVEDFYNTYTDRQLKASRQKESTFDILECLQAYPQDTQFDVILFWDLFDYVQPNELKTVISHLTKYCRENTMLFFITSGLDKIPEEPAKFRIIDKQHLSYENHTATTRRSLGYKQSVYKTLLPGFQLFRGFRMSSGMEENLFVYKP